MSRKKTDRIKLQFNRLKYFLKHDFLTLDNIVLTAAIVLCLVWTFNSIQSISRNWQLTEKLSTTTQEYELAKIEVETMELENEYYATEEYQEIAAHAVNKQFSGEHLVYLPENSDEAKNKHKTESTESTETQTLSNPEQWLQMLFPSI